MNCLARASLPCSCIATGLSSQSSPACRKSCQARPTRFLPPCLTRILLWLLQILICQNLRNNLQHPNEYLRGVTLRFLCRIREEEILEPLIPSILACLDHRHSYVRRNAVLAVAALYKLPKGELLLQDAPDLIEKVGAVFRHQAVSVGRSVCKQDAAQHVGQPHFDLLLGGSLFCPPLACIHERERERERGARGKECVRA